MKKLLSLILALILTFSLGLFAFAEQPVTVNEAKSLAIQYLGYEKVITSVAREDTYYHSYEGEVPVYNVITELKLNSGRTLVLSSYVDMYSGKVYEHTAYFKGFEALLTRNISQDEAYQLALEAFGPDKNDIVVLKKESVVTEDGEVAYHFIFCEDYFERHECTVRAKNGFIEDITINYPSNIIDRIILMFKVLIAKLNILGRL